MAQNRFVNWFFAYGSGLSFTKTGPVIVNGGKTATEEGVATISDPCGNLLFYSDGTAIWTKNHSLMVNGGGLKGNTQSAEAVLIVPKPLSDSLYYVFTTDDYGGTDGLHYSIVDMSKQGGDGEIVVKNIKLYGKSSEKLTAIVHSNKKDYWILSHDWDSAKYKVYLLTEKGLNTSPIISKLGPVTNTSIENALGHLRPSSDGAWVASTYWYQNTLEIYSFNASNGVLSAKYTSNQFDHQRPYSIEFSPDNKLLYVGEAATGGNNDIYQFEMAAFTTGSNRYKVVTANYRFGNFGLGPDGKFYIAKFDQNYLAVISSPNTFGSGCSYTSNGLSLGTQKSKLGLPNPIFPIVITEPEYSMSVLPGCKLSDPVKFELISNFCYDSLIWDLSDFSSTDNYSKKRKLTHVYPYKGNYDVTLKVYYNGITYTYNKNVKMPAGPIVDLGNDLFFCDQLSHFLDAGNPGASYLWNDNYTGKFRNITQPGLYFVTVTSGECSSSDTIRIKNESSLKLGNDTVLCFANSYTYDLPQADSIIWQNGANTKSRVILAPGGLFRATVYKNGCTKLDTISIVLPELQSNPLPSDTSLCEGLSISVALSNSTLNYLWNTGDTTGSKSISKAGKYKLTQWFKTCKYSDSFNVSIIPKIKLPRLRDTSICIGDTLELNTPLNLFPVKINSTYTNGNRHVFFEAGTFLVKAENICFADSFQLNLILDSCRKMDVAIPDIFSPNGDGLNERFNPVLLGDASKVIDYAFRIYNRWGEQIYYSNSPSDGWNGTYRDLMCPLGYYLWTFQYKYNELGEVKSGRYKGIVYIAR